MSCGCEGSCGGAGGCGQKARPAPSGCQAHLAENVDTKLVFDEIINGNGGVTYYSPPKFNDFLGYSEFVNFQLIADYVSGSIPSTTLAYVDIQSSANERDWFSGFDFDALMDTFVFDPDTTATTSVSWDDSVEEPAGGVNNPAAHAFLSRVKVTPAGGSVTFRLRVYATVKKAAGVWNGGAIRSLMNSPVAQLIGNPWQPPHDDSDVVGYDYEEPATNVIKPPASDTSLGPFNRPSNKTTSYDYDGKSNLTDYVPGLLNIGTPDPGLPQPEPPPDCYSGCQL